MMLQYDARPPPPSCKRAVWVTHCQLCAHFQQCVQFALVAGQLGHQPAVKQQRGTLAGGGGREGAAAAVQRDREHKPLSRHIDRQTVDKGGTQHQVVQTQDQHDTGLLMVV